MDLQSFLRWAIRNRLGIAKYGKISSVNFGANMSAKVSGSVVAEFPSPAEQYLEPPLDLNELLVKRLAATYFVRVEGDSMVGLHTQIRGEDLKGLRNPSYER